jgi:hypothetical protein
MMNRIDLVNLTDKMMSFELPHKVVCRALGVCQCRKHAAPSINIAKKSALTNRPGEYALVPAIIEARDAGKLRIKERKPQPATSTPRNVAPVEVPIEMVVKSSKSRRFKDEA